MESEYIVFVYGTLKPGGHYWPIFCEGKTVGSAVSAKIRGSLYDLHVGYPGMVLDDSGWVCGFLLTFRREADFLDLDRLEGFVPGRHASRNEYNRLKVPCFSPDGGALGEFWGYEMSMVSVNRHKGTRMESGNWQV